MNKHGGVAVGLFQLQFAFSMTKMMGGYIGKWEPCRRDPNANFARDTLRTFLGFPKLVGNSSVSHFLMIMCVNMHKGGVEVWVVNLDFWGGLETTRLCVGGPEGVSHYTGSPADKKPIRTKQKGPETIKCESHMVNTMYTNREIRTIRIFQHGNSDNPNFPT